MTIPEPQTPARRGRRACWTAASKLILTCPRVWTSIGACRVRQPRQLQLPLAFSHQASKLFIGKLASQRPFLASEEAEVDLEVRAVEFITFLIVDPRPPIVVILASRAMQTILPVRNIRFWKSNKSIPVRKKLRFCFFGVGGKLDMMRVRATDPRPCPKCGKVYRSAHTLRTHMEDKHTLCPGYRCVLCGTVAKSRNSLHSHMSRQHRGISTKDLPVLPMPSPFDAELASR
jgi:hypothetical protein